MCKRHKHITLCQPDGTAAVRHQCMNACKVSTYFSILKNVLVENKLIDKSQNTWNTDETGMQFDYHLRKIIAKTGVNYLHSRTSGNQETITTIACVSAVDNSLSLHFIDKGKTNRSLCSF